MRPIMFTSSNRRAGAALVFCFALAAAACGGDDSSPASPTTPTPDPEPVTLSGTWTGPVDGVLVDGDARAVLTQSGSDVTGDEWSMPMPAALVAFGAPADVPLTGPVTGSVSGTTAALTFGFLAVYADYFGSTECAIAVTVTSFSQTTLEATWTTNDSCRAPAVDQGTLTFTRQ